MLVAAHLSVGCAGTTQIGTRLGDTFIYTSRQAWDCSFMTNADDHRAYRLGNDLVVFIETNRVSRTLWMSAATDFSPDELKRLAHSSQRSDIPHRDDKIFDSLDISRGWQHIPRKEDE